MEMSYIPTRKPEREDRDEYSGGTARRERGKREKFGAGLEKGEMREEVGGRGGRTERRHVGRSASKKVFRRR